MAIDPDDSGYPELPENYKMPKRAINEGNAKCPRCHSNATVATSTQYPIQYRVCRVPICRNRFKVVLGYGV